MTSKSNKYRRYYVKKDKNVCWRCTNKACKASFLKHETELSKNLGFIVT